MSYVFAVRKHAIAVGRIFRTRELNGYSHKLLCTGHMFRSFQLGKWGIAAITYQR